MSKTTTERTVEGALAHAERIRQRPEGYDDVWRTDFLLLAEEVKRLRAENEELAARLSAWRTESGDVLRDCLMDALKSQ